MTQFHQEHQQVFGSQHNAGRDITIGEPASGAGSVQNIDDLSALLLHLQSDIIQAMAAGSVPKKTIIDANTALTRAVVEVEEPKPNKQRLLDYLTTTKTLMEGITAIGGFVPVVITAIEAVHKVIA